MNDRLKLIIGGLVVAFVFVGVGVFALGFANETVDAIERLFGASEWETWFPPLPGYALPGFEGNAVASFLVALGFTGLVLVVTLGTMRLLTRRPKGQGKPSADDHPLSS